MNKLKEQYRIRNQLQIYSIFFRLNPNVNMDMASTHDTYRIEFCLHLKKSSIHI